MSKHTDLIEQHEACCPNHCAELIKEFDIELHPNDRRPPPGHRTPCTPTTALVDLKSLLEGGLGLGAQIHAYRRVRNIKLAQRVKWRAAAIDLLADACQLGDEYLPRNRAERIAEQADLPKAVKLLQDWVYAEDEVAA